MNWTILLLTHFIFLFVMIHAQYNDCDASGSDGSYIETLSTTSDNVRNIKSTGCPSNNINVVCRVFQSTGPKKPQDKNINIPSVPFLCDESWGAHSFSDAAFKWGAGILFDGVSVYPGSNCPITLIEYDEDVCFDPLYEESFDCCNGHPDANSQYHYHTTPKCVLSEIGDRRNNNGHSKQIGWAFDGFPIYGPYGMGTNQFIYPCTHGARNENDCLDECNGHMHPLPGSQFLYHYHFAGTADGEQYPDVGQRPYSIGCFKGKPIWDSISLRPPLDTRICSTPGVKPGYTPTVSDNPVYDASNSPMFVIEIGIDDYKYIIVFGSIIAILWVVLMAQYWYQYYCKGSKVVHWAEEDTNNIL